jgi:hypothetical protein
VLELPSELELPSVLDVLVAAGALAELVLAPLVWLLAVDELLDDELPLSIAPSARAVKPELPLLPGSCVAEGAVGEVIPDCLKFASAPSSAGSTVLISPAPL